MKTYLPLQAPIGVLKRPSNESVEFAQKIIHILKRSDCNHDRVYFIESPSMTPGQPSEVAVCHNGYILH